MFVLDTNVVSETRYFGQGRGHANVKEWLDEQDAALLYISAITVMELEYGCLLVERRDKRQGSALRDWLMLRLAVYGDRILPLDTTVAARAASLHVPDPRPDRDAIIAATALTHGHAVVTRNVQDFRIDDLEVINPWRDE